MRVSSFREHVRCLPARANASINLHHSSERYGLVSLLRRPALRMGFRNNRLSDGAWTHSHPKNIGEYIGRPICGCWAPTVPSIPTRRR